MSTLSSKSAQEISELLDQYGIKHGPVVDSTRGLYEKKLREAMAKGTAVKPSSDKTFYREEQEEITYVHRRVPLRNEAFMDSGKSYTERYREEEDESGDQPGLYRTEAFDRYVSHSTPPPLKTSSTAARKETTTRDTWLIPLWLQFLVFLGVAAFLYYVFTCMETPEKNPFKRVE
ncbi:emerin (Emery-Dreifuss muscular dystrophy) [Megalops cyprinoides]|uniref:emerin (Emery-Dreifuss muscular dystrophy) n=1 Tax=Megalops cyprinoides TaxID=118141 RepID=UPI0018650870|nr:emerin (Emery-Dreifuss muscular dystrophy) [Megalops cyprinoides]